MSAIFKFLFERATDPLGLPINAFYEYIILAVIGAVPMVSHTARSVICTTAVLSAAGRKARSFIGSSDLFSLWGCGFLPTVLFRDITLLPPTGRSFL